MNEDRLEEALADTLRDRTLREDDVGKYHPSEITGCPLKVVLNKLGGNKTILNCWLFQGSAVHHYLQETGIMTDALNSAGYHPLDTEYEVHREYRLTDEVTLTGTCDILCSDGDNLTIFDIKYSSLKPSYGHERIYKYFAQVNTYAFMFGADEYGLMMFNSKSQDLLGDEQGSDSDINVLSGTPKEDNWEVVTDKAVAIHNCLQEYGFDGATVVPVDDMSLEHEVVQNVASSLAGEVGEGQMPSYDQECKYCDHKEHCPSYQGELDQDNSGFKAFGN